MAAGWQEPFVILASEVSPLAADTQLKPRVLPLLENLARAAAPGYAALWLPDAPPGALGAPSAPPLSPGGTPSATGTAAVAGAPASAVAPEPDSGWAVLLWCQVGTGEGVPAALRAGPASSIADQRRRPGVRTLTEIPDGGRTVGTIMIGSGDDGVAAAVPGPLLDQSRDCIALLLREWRLAMVLRDQVSGADRRAEQLLRVEADLAAVREVERQRLAGWVLAGTTRQLAEVSRHARDLESVVQANPHQALGALRELRRCVNDLNDDFRIVVRGVHPTMLRSRGPVAALSELAAQLPRGIQFTGDLGRRVGWEVESGIYHATAAVLSVLTEPVRTTGTADATSPSAVTTTERTPVVAGAANPPLSVGFMRADRRLIVRISDPSPPPAGEVRAALADDRQRMEALGGGLSHHVSGPGSGLTELWLPERLTGIDVPTPESPATHGPVTGGPPALHRPR